MKATRHTDGTYTLEGSPQEMRELLAAPADAIGITIEQKSFRESGTKEIAAFAFEMNDSGWFTSDAARRTIHGASRASRPA